MVRHAALKHSTHKKRETSGAPAAADAHPSRAKHPAHSLDRLIHERMRLGIISALAANESLTFNDLKQLMHTTASSKTVVILPAPSRLRGDSRKRNTS